MNTGTNYVHSPAVYVLVKLVIRQKYIVSCRKDKSQIQQAMVYTFCPLQLLHYYKQDFYIQIIPFGLINKDIQNTGETVITFFTIQYFETSEKQYLIERKEISTSSGRSPEVR